MPCSPRDTAQTQESQENCHSHRQLLHDKRSFHNQAGPTHRAGEGGSLTQGTSSWAALGTTGELPFDDAAEVAL